MSSQPRLEVIASLPDGTAKETAILFVHGMWHAAWCWEENFLEHFSGLGYESYAVSLRGHGGSDGELRKTGIRDYVRDLESVTAQLPTPPVIVAHSMGARVLQKYLEQHPARAAVMIAPAPLKGAWRATLRTARRIPRAFTRANTKRTMYAIVDTPGKVKAAFLSNRVHDNVAALVADRVQEGSYRAYWDLLALAPASAKGVDLPVLVMAAGQDRIFGPSETTSVANAYGARYVSFDDMGHNIMNEPDWPKAAGYMAEWLHQIKVI